MTIASTITSKQYTGNGVTTQFAFPNKIFAAADLVVTIIDNLGNQYPFTNFANVTLGLTYTVQGVDVDTGAIIVLSGPLTNNWTIDIRSLTPDLQSTSIKNQGSFFPELHEEAFDRLTRMIQDVLRLTYTYGIHGSDIELVPWPALPGPSIRKGMASMFDAITGLPTIGVPNTQVITTGLLAPFLGLSQTGAEAAVGVVPTNLIYQDEPRRYGAVLDGITDDTAAIQNWAKVGGKRTWPANLTAKISAVIPLVSNTTIVGGGYGSQITQVTTNLDIFYLNGVNNIVITDMGFYGAAASGGLPFQAPIHCVESNDITVERCRFQNFSFICVAVQGTTAANNQRIKVRNCRFDNWNATTMQDCTPVGFLDYALNCEMVDCNVIGNGTAPYHGVLVQNTNGTVGSYSRGHLIQGNQIYNVYCYGIPMYRVNLNGFVDKHRIIGNLIDTVSGTALAGTSGAGIYLQGASAVISGNHLLNTNVNTTTETLAPAAIGMNNITGDVEISGNKIESPNWYGIMGVSNKSAVISAITRVAQAVVTTSDTAATNPFQVGQEVTFTGVAGMTQINGLYSTVVATGGSSGAWTITVNINSSAFSVYTSGGSLVLAPQVSISGNTVLNATKTCIYLKDFENVSITGNKLDASATGTGRGILCASVGTTQRSRLEISGNKIVSPASALVEVDYYNDVTISGNNILSSVATGALAGLVITNSNRVTINGNNTNMGASTAVGLQLTSVTGAVVTGNGFVTAGGANNVFSSSGTCTGSLVDRTNTFSGINFANSGSGCKVSYNTSSGSPTGGSGTAQTGDEAWSNTGVTPLMYWCSVGGSPGTWLSLAIP